MLTSIITWLFLNAVRPENNRMCQSRRTVPKKVDNLQKFAAVESLMKTLEGIFREDKGSEEVQQRSVAPHKKRSTSDSQVLISCNYSPCHHFSSLHLSSHPLFYPPPPTSHFLSAITATLQTRISSPLALSSVIFIPLLITPLCPDQDRHRRLHLCSPVGKAGLLAHPAGQVHHSIA